MLAHSLLSGVLLIFPVVVTVGIYIGIESQKIFGGGGFDGYGVPTDLSNATRIDTFTYCQKAFGVTPKPERYTYNPNQWGVDADQPSGLCMNITTNSSVPETSKSAAVFTATWQYTQGPADDPVHAFPNAKLDLNSTIPVLLSNLTSLTVDTKWSYNVGNKAANSTDMSALDVAEMNANVCVDMFLASDKVLSQSTTKSQYEVMVWIGRWGAATQPIGNLLGSKDNYEINGTRFDLFTGTNGIKQEVYTWVADSNRTSFTGDIYPLIDRLSNSGGPTGADHLGYVAFGSEALYSTKNVTFYVPQLSLDMTTQTTGSTHLL